LIIVAKSSAPAWTVKHFKSGNIDLKKKIAYVNHYFFHILDPDWGHLTIKISGHPPFGAMIILNGHEWVEHRARKQGLEVGKEGNCFVSNVAAVGRIADTLNASHSIGRDILDRQRVEMTEIGPGAESFFEAFTRQKGLGKYDYRSITGVLALRKKYDRRTINEACKRALLRFPHVQHHKENM
jgi:hypothetical protein